MKKTEIIKKFDAIVEFAGVNKFLDTPVKYYSSGMYVRLAFSVAAHLEPDILIVDEVLAVGDAEFQKKCLGKMSEVSKKEGRTIIFVSHNLAAINYLCQKTVLLDKGRIKTIGETNKVIEQYLSSKEIQQRVIEPELYSNILRGIKVKFNNLNNPAWFLKFKEKIDLNITLDSNETIPDFQLAIGLNTIGGERLFTNHSDKITLKRGQTIFNIAVKNILTPGLYTISIGSSTLFNLPDVARLEIGKDNDNESHLSYNHGFVNSEASFAILSQPE